MPSALPIQPTTHKLLVHEMRLRVETDDGSARPAQAPDAALDATTPKQSAKRAAAADKRAAADAACGIGNQQRVLAMQKDDRC